MKKFNLALAALILSVTTGLAQAEPATIGSAFQQSVDAGRVAEKLRREATAKRTAANNAADKATDAEKTAASGASRAVALKLRAESNEAEAAARKAELDADAAEDEAARLEAILVDRVNVVVPNQTATTTSGSPTSGFTFPRSSGSR